MLWGFGDQEALEVLVEDLGKLRDLTLRMETLTGGLPTRCLFSLYYITQPTRKCSVSYLYLKRINTSYIIYHHLNKYTLLLYYFGFTKIYVEKLATQKAPNCCLLMR